jgi:glucuronate isomerase
MLQRLFEFPDDRLTLDNWEGVYERAERMMAAPDWAQHVMRTSRLEAVFLTNDFDDPLEGFDRQLFIPCLRTDELVFHLAKQSVRERLQAAAAVDLTDLASLRRAIGSRFEHFVSRGARACAISLPPGFEPHEVTLASAEPAWRRLSQSAGNAESSAEDRRTMAHCVFWMLAEFCAQFELPFDLMIGVHRSVYAHGVYQGQDLYDSRVSLYSYRHLLNHFRRVTFPISVLASATNQELTSYAWIFPNVVANGHWWYSNTPNYIELDAAARLEAVPRTKQIAYYSDMYKLEFALPKFAMYKRILAKILAERFVLDRNWTEQRAIDLGQQVLQRNVETVFPRRQV